MRPDVSRQYGKSAPAITSRMMRSRLVVHPLLITKREHHPDLLTVGATAVQVVDGVPGGPRTANP